MLRNAVCRALMRLDQMREAVRGRRAMAAMDARMLADIGVSRAEAEAEVNRWPWDTRSSINAKSSAR